MTMETIIPNNVVDKAASSANRAVDATKRAADAALDSVSSKVESVRSTLSPAFNNASMPLDAALKFTREQPLKAVVGAFALGFTLAALIVRR
jgi:ElaB/YqjD/DUF883 family membrane-anchored ribosome-binding protein